MIIDATGVGNGSTVDCDLAIVGGGMAGLAIAREFAARPATVVVLEGGGEEPDDASQALCAGEARIDDGAGGSIDMGAFLAESRLRCLGGAGNVWGAKCAMLDESDFAKRAWLRESGWPFSRRELRPFYDRACDLLRIRKFDYDPETEFDKGRPPLALDGHARFTTATRHLSPVRRGPTGSALRDYTAAATDPANVAVYLRANAVEIETDDAGALAKAVRVATLAGNRFRVAARKAIVLAAGGVENARLLLSSRTVAKPGLGNARGQVGRYFANHATFGPGSAIGFSSAKAEALDLYTTRDPRKVWGVLALTSAAQERERLPNFTVTFSPPEGDPDRDDADVIAAAALADAGYSPGGAEPNAPVPVYFMSEQAPNAESRVTLSESTDALGQPRARLDWRFLKDDSDALLRSIRYFGRELGRTATGRVRCDWPDPKASPISRLSPSRHHIGTTRMSADSGKGVVDVDAMVHGVENLFVAGSSVFPTSGIGNPTLTLLALALRLADHLDRRFRG